MDGEFQTAEKDYTNNEVRSVSFYVLSTAKEGPDVDGGGPNWAVILIVLIICIAIFAAVLFVLRRGGDKPAMCSECGSPLDLTETQCPKCGAEFGEEVECGECGGLMGISDATCPHCGATFIAGADIHITANDRLYESWTIVSGTGAYANLTGGGGADTGPTPSGLWQDHMYGRISNSGS